jgi:hypothetical protein
MRQSSRSVGRGYRRTASRPIKYTEPVTVNSGWSLSMCALVLVCVFCATLYVRYLVWGS